MSSLFGWDDGSRGERASRVIGWGGELVSQLVNAFSSMGEEMTG